MFLWGSTGRKALKDEKNYIKTHNFVLVYLSCSPLTKRSMFRQPRFIRPLAQFSLFRNINPNASTAKYFS